MQKLEFVYKLDSQKSTEIWEKLFSVLEQMESTSSFSLYGKKIKAFKVQAELTKLGSTGFNIESANFIFDMSTVRNYEHILLQIESKNSNSNWWSCWVDKLNKLDGFVQAWLVDIEFNYWQNASDPIEYESKEKSYEGLPMISNGLPAPLEQLEIDTSKNLGLRKLCDGYVEAVGAKMWLSNDFLKLTDNDIKNISSKSGANVEELSNGIYELSMSTNLFVDDSSSNEQRNLRKALYC